MKRLLSGKRFILPAVSVLFVVSIALLLKKTGTRPGTPINISALTEEEEEKSAASDDPVRRMNEEFDMLKDPATGQIPLNIRMQELQAAEVAPLKENLGAARVLSANSYTFAGPSNLGGRIRGLMYDVRYDGVSNKTIFASGVSGGVFRSMDDGTTWAKVSPDNALYSVTCIVQDPRPGSQDTWYYGTGEGLGNSTSATSAFYLGFGVYKSTDNGSTWNKVLNSPFAEGALEAFDSRFDVVSSLAVNPLNGDLYAGTLNTVMRLPAASSSWVTELGVFGGNSGGVVDVKVGSDGVVYAAIPGNGGTAAANEGIWRKNATNTWVRIAGGGSPAWFNTGATLGRTMLAIDPSNEKNVYAVYYNGTTSSCAGIAAPEAEFGKYDTSSQAWVDLSAGLPNETGCSDGNDPFAVQGGYDLIMAVKPGNPNVIFLGGTNIYRLNSSDQFTTAGYTTTRAGGYAGTGGYARYTNSHSDIHTIAFQPGSPNIMLCGDDGGLQRTTDNTAGTVAWTDISSGLTTYQFYYVAIDPTNGSTKYIGGAQDNGTSYRDAGSNVFARALSGDGVSVGISAGNTMHFLGSQNGTMYRKAPALAEGFISANLTPSGATLSASRLFVTLFHLDNDNTENLYYVDFNELWRATNATTATSFATDFTEISGVRTTIGGVRIRSLATSRGAYNAAKSKLFFGTEDGRVFRLDDPVNAAAATAPVLINNASGMPSGTIIDLAVNPRSSDTVVAVYSNYGVSSIWFCGNATTGSPTWTNIEGPVVSLQSIRSVAMVITSGTPAPAAPGPLGTLATNNIEYYVGTSTGLYSATDLNGTSTVWSKEGSSTIGNAVVSALAYRPSDNTLLVGTHGNGMFVTTVPFVSLPVTFAYFKGYVSGEKAVLEWQTTSEKDNKGYEIERSYDGNKFEKIGFVSASTFSASVKNYTFTDNAPLAAIQYYRLKQVDLDNKTVYSKVVLVKYNENAAPRLLYVNNPFAGELRFTLSKPLDSKGRVQLIDMNGRVIMNREVAANSGNIITLPVSNLPHGTYIVNLKSTLLNETRRVVKQ